MKPELKAALWIMMFGMLIFAVLAIYFNHWWIALFGLLLNVSYHDEIKDDNKKDFDHHFEEIQKEIDKSSDFNAKKNPNDIPHEINEGHYGFRYDSVKNKTESEGTELLRH